MVGCVVHDYECVAGLFNDPVEGDDRRVGRGNLVETDLADVHLTPSRRLPMYG